MRWRSLLPECLAVLIVAGCATHTPRSPDDASRTSMLPPHVRLTTPADVRSRLAEESPDSLWTRMQTGFELQDARDHENVRYWIEYYAARGQGVETILARATPFLWRIVDNVAQHGMPMEIALLPAVESSFNPLARSNRHAAGLWQFIPVTAARFGLQRNWWYDARGDIVHSTRAALEYLEYLIGLFDGNWLHALAAYNAGEGRVMRAIRSNLARGLPTDYWHLPLPSETRAYVPKLLAISAMVDQPQRYGIRLPDMPNERRLEVVTLPQQVDLSLAADLAGLSLKSLRSLNPGYKRWATAPDGPHRLLLPRDRVDRFLSNLARVPEGHLVTWRRHVVAGGDTLGGIAERYGATVRLLKQVNDLSGSLIRIGQALLIPSGGSAAGAAAVVAGDPAPPPAPVQHTVRSGESLWLLAQRYDVSVSALVRWNGLGGDAILRPGQELLVRLEGDGSTVYYQVRDGDSLSAIARLYGVSVADLRRWNDLENNRYLQPGQRLEVRLQPPPATASNQG